MDYLNDDDLCGLFATARIDETLDMAATIVHKGVTETGRMFLLVNDCHGNSCIAYGE